MHHGACRPAPGRAPDWHHPPVLLQDDPGEQRRRRHVVHRLLARALSVLRRVRVGRRVGRERGWHAGQAVQDAAASDRGCARRPAGVVGPETRRVYGARSARRVPGGEAALRFFADDVHQQGLRGVHQPRPDRCRQRRLRRRREPRAPPAREDARNVRRSLPRRRHQLRNERVRERHRQRGPAPARGGGQHREHLLRRSRDCAVLATAVVRDPGTRLLSFEVDLLKQ
mmetsp:Transcript_26904/g.88285  ORF Transcript_26904/g.88285 Transcript_26904/m.88285 type:complete len:227 (-) Transcript_26904:178-858(-)